MELVLNELTAAKKKAAKKREKKKLDKKNKKPVTQADTTKSTEPATKASTKSKAQKKKERKVILNLLKQTKLTEVVPLAKKEEIVLTGGEKRKADSSVDKFETEFNQKKLKLEMKSQQDPAQNDNKLAVAKKKGNVQKKNVPFRRIVEDEVDKSLLNKMGKNSFVFKKGAEGSWGEKANQDLIHTRGKSFRAEKNKKKRGSYRGGKIDFASHSIKYDDSD